MATTPNNNANVWHRRLVAESGAKACWICYKPSTCVLITVDNSDWFHVCPGHLTDTKFAIPKDADDLAKKKHEEEIEIEIAAVKKEYEEKMRKKLDRRKQKEHEKDGNQTKEDKKQEDKEDAKEEKEKDAKLKELEDKKQPEKAPIAIAGPRVFELQKHFYQMRLQKRRDQEQAKRNRERLRNPTAFPSVPSGDP